jgi:hypothetical protein
MKGLSSERAEDERPVIWHCLSPIDLAGYCEVQAITKESVIPAWMKLLGGLGPYPYYFRQELRIRLAIR